MYRFCYVEGVAGNAREVNRQTFGEIVRREQVKRVCEQIAQSKDAGEMGRLKRKLPAFCWHAWFEGGKRRNHAAHASGLVMMDVDHVEEPRELWLGLRDRCLDLKVLVAHVTPSRQGLRLVFPVPAAPSGGHMTLADAQAYYAKALDLKNVDTCTKDLARLSFCVPEEYFLYVDEERLFDGPCHEVHLPGAGRTDNASMAAEGADAAPSGQEEAPGGRAAKAFEQEYDGIPYRQIVDSLQELLGGVPAHGSRNNFIFSMAAYLRYVCNDDAEWIASVLPTYGESAEKWRRTIGSACQRAQYRAMPQIVRRAIENARRRMAATYRNVEGEQNQLPPAMPRKLPRLIAHLVKNVPEVCRPSVANAVFPALAAHLNGVKFWLIDGTEKEATFMCVTMAKQSSGKSAVNKPIEYICADIVERDELNRRREQEWKDATSQKGANKEKPKRPDDLCVQVLVSDMTNAAFVQRMKDANGRYLYTNLEELDLLKQLQTNGTKDVGKIICLCFDNGKYGQERVGTQSVTGRVEIRWNWNASSTIQKGVQFFRGRMVDGTLSRLNFCTIIPDKSKPFVYGHYDEKYAEDLKPYITNLNLANGHVDCKQALDLARKMSEECAEEAALSGDDVYQDMAHRAVTIAYLKAMVLYIAHDMTWSKDIAEFAEWSLRYDLWCKSHFFGEQVKEEQEREVVRKCPGRKNLLDLLPESFSMEEAANIRRQQGMTDAPRQMVSLWVFRGYVEQDATGRYVKTEKYLARTRGRSYER